MNIENRWKVPLDGIPRRKGRALPLIVLLTVTIALALEATSSLAAPVAEAGPSIAEFTGRPVVFEGFGTADDTHIIILYEWDFDGDEVFDWNSTRAGIATHRFWEAGEYNATLRVTQYNSSSTELLTDTDMTSVKIRSGRPVGHINTDGSALLNAEHVITAQYYDPDGGQLTFEWTVDGVFASEEASFKYRFTEEGSHNVTLRTTDDEGEWEDDQVTIKVVRELDEEATPVPYTGIIIVAIALAVVALIAYMSMSKGHRAAEGGGPPGRFVGAAGSSPEIVTEASLADRDSEVTPRSKPRVVRPERVVVRPGKGKARDEPEVAGAPARLPCPECGTTLSEDGTCPFCSANEAIDAVEKHLRELQEGGYILAKAEEELDAAKTELHIKNFMVVEESLARSRDLMEEAVREHERCLTLMALNEDLVDLAKDKDLDVTKAANLIKLSKSFLKSGKYDKAVYYAERSRDFLLDNLEPFDLDRYFCEHCRGEVTEGDDECPHCEKPIESGILKRAKRELAELRSRFEGLSRDADETEPIAAQLEKANEHVENRSASAANENIRKARSLLDEAEGGEDAPEGEVPPHEGEGPEGGGA